MKSSISKEETWHNGIHVLYVIKFAKDKVENTSAYLIANMDTNIHQITHIGTHAMEKPHTGVVEYVKGMIC